MFSVLSFVMLSCVFADVAVRRGAEVLAWLKGAAADVEKKL